MRPRYLYLVSLLCPAQSTVSILFSRFRHSISRWCPFRLGCETMSLTRSRLQVEMRRPAENPGKARCQVTKEVPITTNEIGASGSSVLYMDSRNDPCICVTLLQQNQHHGNCVMPSTSEAGLPICRFASKPIFK